MTNPEKQLLACLEMHAEFTMLHDNCLVFMTFFGLVFIGVGAELGF